MPKEERNQRNLEYLLRHRRKNKRLFILRIFYKFHSLDEMNYIRLLLMFLASNFWDRRRGSMILNSISAVQLPMRAIWARQYLLKASNAKLEVSTATKAKLAGACPKREAVPQNAFNYFHACRAKLAGACPKRKAVSQKCVAYYPITLPEFRREPLKPLI